MIRFTYKGKTLAYMPTVGATIEQLKVAQQIVASLFGYNPNSIIIKV